MAALEPVERAELLGRPEVKFLLDTTRVDRVRRNSGFKRARGCKKGGSWMRREGMREEEEEEEALKRVGVAGEEEAVLNGVEMGFG